MPRRRRHSKANQTALSALALIVTPSSSIYQVTPSATITFDPHPHPLLKTNDAEKSQAAEQSRRPPRKGKPLKEKRRISQVMKELLKNRMTSRPVGLAPGRTGLFFRPEKSSIPTPGRPRCNTSKPNGCTSYAETLQAARHQGSGEKTPRNRHDPTSESAPRKARTSSKAP